MGINACKGQSSCKTTNDARKGQGFVELDEETCDQVGGQFEGA
jgi:hypothetical protein